MKFSISILLVFLCLFQPYIGQYSAFHLMIIFPLLYFGRLYKINKDEFFLIICMIVLIAFNVLMGILKTGIFNHRLFFVFSLNILMLFLAKLVVTYSFKPRNRCYLNNIIIYAVAINSLFIILLNTNFINANSFYSIITTNPLVFSYPIPRYPGFTFDAFSYISTLTAFAFYLLLQNYLSFKCIGIFKFLFLTVLLLISIAFSGRTGILLSLFYILFFLIFLIKKNKALKIILIITPTILILFNLNWYDYEWMKDWVFGFITNISSGTAIEKSDSSITGVVQSIFLPENIIIGDEVSFSSVSSDLGFIRILVSSGIIGLFITLLLFFLPYYYVSIKYKSLTLFILTTSLFLLNAKDVYIVSPYGHFMLLNIYLVYTIQNNIELKNDI